MTEMRDRFDLALLCNDLNLRYAVEVGCECGVFASRFLERWHGAMMYCVDPFEPYPEMPFDRTADIMISAIKLAPHVPRVKIIRSSSVEGAKIIAPLHRIDFVYLDGAHEYEDVVTDIAAWWPIIHSGGILSGHDYGREHKGVAKAVDELCQREKLELNRLKCDDINWWVRKP
jgi:Methyltransferase domain